MTLVVGRDVFIRSGAYGDWGKVVEVTPTGAIVQSDPCYGAQLIRFDKNGTACDTRERGRQELLGRQTTKLTRMSTKLVDIRATGVLLRVMLRTPSPAHSYSIFHFVR